MEKIRFRASGADALRATAKGTFTETQGKKLEALQNRTKALTPKMEIEMADLLQRQAAPPELSQTAKTMVHDMWLQDQYGYREIVDTNALWKGTLQEEIAIELVSELDNTFYNKNEERKKNDMFSGECDLYIPEESKIIDIKCNYSLRTFHGTDHGSVGYQTQGQVYMELWDVEQFEICYCLVPSPDWMIEAEIARTHRQFEKMGMGESPELEQRLEQIKNNSNYDAIPKKDRVKRFLFQRDREFMAALRAKGEMARAYYNTIKL